jgi:hypothetical protein
MALFQNVLWPALCAGTDRDRALLNSSAPHRMRDWDPVLTKQTE